MIWSNAYDNKVRDAIVSMEKECLWERHRGKNEPETLLIVNSDNTPLHDRYNSILMHRLHDQGLVGLRNIIISRLKELSGRKTEYGVLHHPKRTELDRGPLYPCNFIIVTNYFNDRLRR